MHGADFWSVCHGYKGAEPLCTQPLPNLESLPIHSSVRSPSHYVPTVLSAPSNAQDPLHTFPRNFHVDGCCGLVIDLLRTCYGETGVVYFGDN